MNKEEIIQDFKDIVEEARTECNFEYYQKLSNTLNLIYKQQKEIEITAKWQLIATTNYWKEKIRDKIKELEEIENKGDMAQFIAITEKIKVLNELLGE